MNKNILIAGGAGFIGSHLCERFLNKGENVICVDNLSTSSGKNVLKFLRQKNFRFIKADVRNRINDISDLRELFNQANDNYAVMVAKHDYTPKSTQKMDGRTQTVYPRKNWSSCMLWNCEHPSNKLLDLNALNTNDGLWHHRFVWLKDEEIGQISHEWNWLTDWYEEPNDGKPKMLHYTEGGPWFEHLQDVPYAQQWREARDEYQASLVKSVDDKIAEDDGGW